LAQRLALARRMLTDPRWIGRPISAIAFAAGFADLSHFNRTFRRCFGATPSEIRARAPRARASEWRSRRPFYRVHTALDAQLDSAQAGNDGDKRHDLDHAQRGDRAVAAALLPHGQTDGSEHMGAGADEEYRRAELAHRQNENVDPACQQYRRQQRKDDAREDLGEPSARDRRRFLELAVDLGDPARRESHAVRKI